MKRKPAIRLAGGKNGVLSCAQALSGAEEMFNENRMIDFLRPRHLLCDLAVPVLQPAGLERLEDRSADAVVIGLDRRPSTRINLAQQILIQKPVDLAAGGRLLGHRAQEGLFGQRTPRNGDDLENGAL